MTTFEPYEHADAPAELRADYRLAWTAYIWPTVLFGLGVLGGWVISGMSFRLALGWWVVVLAMYVYAIALRGTVRLFLDDNGVWMYMGLFPWSRGISGVKWRDVSQAGYFPSLLSWLCKSYTVEVGHRFTKSDELRLSHVHRGDDAVAAINSYHMRLVRGDLPPVQTIAATVIDDLPYVDAEFRPVGQR